MSKGQGARARQKAAAADVTQRVYYALSRGDLSNPYPVTDRRHGKFAMELARVQGVDADLRMTHILMGGREADLQPRALPDPGPVQPIEVLGERWRATHPTFG